MSEPQTARQFNGPRLGEFYDVEPQVVFPTPITTVPSLPNMTVITVDLRTEVAREIQNWEHDTVIDGPYGKQYEKHRSDCRRCAIEHILGGG